MRMDTTEIARTQQVTGSYVTRKCDNGLCGRPIMSSYLFKAKDGREACSDNCRAALEGREIQTKPKETDPMKTLNAPTTTSATTKSNRKLKTKATGPVTPAPKAAAKTKTAPAAATELSPRKALMALSMEDRLAGKFPENHPLGIFFKMLNGTKGGNKAVALADLEKACPEGFQAGNMLKVLDWYGNTENPEHLGTGFGLRVKTDKATGMVTLTKAAKKTDVAA